MQSEYKELVVHGLGWIHKHSVRILPNCLRISHSPCTGCQRQSENWDGYRYFWQFRTVWILFLHAQKNTKPIRMMIWRLQIRISVMESVRIPPDVLQFRVFLAVEDSEMCFVFFCADKKGWKYGKTKNQKNRTSSLFHGLWQRLRSFLLQIPGTRVERSLWPTSHPTTVKTGILKNNSPPQPRRVFYESGRLSVAWTGPMRFHPPPLRKKNGIW